MFVGIMFTSSFLNSTERYLYNFSVLLRTVHKRKDGDQQNSPL